MNKLIVLLLTFSLISCVQQVEPIDENAEPAKLNQILVSEIKTDRAQISWSQDVAGTGYVEYGFTTSYGSISPMQKSNLLDHTIQLANLSADTVYHYKIVSVDKNLNRVLSGDMTFKTAKVEATPAPTPTPSPTPSPVKEAKAPSLIKAVLSGDNYVLTLSQAADSLTPAGGYDTFINNQDQNDNASFTGLTRTISGLDKTKEQCFKVEARYTQLTPQVFPSSNEICVAGFVAAPVVKNPVLMKATLSGDNYLLTLSQPAGSILPSGGYDTFINNQDQNDNASFSGLTRTISGLDKTKEQCFKVEARYTQLTPQVFPSSNEICVAGVSAPAPSPTPTPAPTPPPVTAELKAFPSAFGAGAYTEGGRGGKIIRVTNLNANGTGSFVAALQATGKRYVVFDVSGTIDLKGSQVYVNGSSRSNLTVFGQSAPRGGITVMNGNINFYEVNNVIIRFIRFRNAEMSGGNPVEQDSFTYWGGTDIILDHCSASFGGDEAISMVATSRAKIQNVTLQRSLMGNSKTGSILGSSSRPNMVGDMSYHLNLIADNGHRTPNIGGSARFDVINNVIFNWHGRASTVNAGTPEVNHIANYYKTGKYTTDWPMPDTANKIQSGTPLIYSQENYFQGVLAGDNNENNEGIWKTFRGSKPVSSSNFTSIQFKVLGAALPVLSPEKAYTVVLSDVGANRYIDDNGVVNFYMDSYDTTKIDHVKKRISGYKFNDWTMPKLPSSSRPSNYDSDNDGMSDAWEKRMFGSLAESANGDKDKNGYTNLEDFMNQVDYQ